MFDLVLTLEGVEPATNPGCYGVLNLVSQLAGQGIAVGAHLQVEACATIAG